MSESEEQRVGDGTRESPFEGWVCADGKTLAYPCRHCGLLHRHRIQGGERYGTLCNRGSHCVAPGAPDPVWFRLQGVVMLDAQSINDAL